ncbi:cell division protein FtsL [Brevundimonas balnearis]|uniref:Cell division protein n=1 Tax=Brevundimonas balnearis TaxID=1572858 RepID=A0ABV6R4E9_9CAUL
MTAIRRLFDWKLRGIRVVEIVGVGLVAVMVLSVYVAKAAAARESARIAELERSIAETSQRVRLLRAEAARLESPARLAALSAQAGLEPVVTEQLVAEPELEAIAPPPPVVQLPEGEVVR